MPCSPHVITILFLTIFLSESALPALQPGYSTGSLAHQHWLSPCDGSSESQHVTERIITTYIFNITAVLYGINESTLSLESLVLDVVVGGDHFIFHLMIYLFIPL